LSQVNLWQLAKTGDTATRCQPSIYFPHLIFKNISSLRLCNVCHDQLGRKTTIKKTCYYTIGVRKKPRNRLNRENREKNNQKNRTVKKNRLNRLEFLKKISIRFGFGFRNLKPEKPQLNRTQFKGYYKYKKKRVIFLNPSVQTPAVLLQFSFPLSRSLNSHRSDRPLSLTDRPLSLKSS